MDKKKVTVNLSFTITATISQISEIPKELFEKIKELDNDDVDWQNPIFQELDDLVDYSQAFSIDEFQNIGIRKYKSKK